MNISTVIKEFQERYNKILALDSDKAFFVEVLRYTDYSLDVQDEIPQLRQFILEEIKVAEKELDEYEQTFKSIEKLMTKTEEFTKDDEHSLLKNSGLLSKLQLKRTTSIADAWSNLFILWRFVNETEDMFGYWNDDSVSNDVSNKLSNIFAEMNHLFNNPFFQNTSSNQSTKVSNNKQASRKNNQFITKENYLNFITIVHNFIMEKMNNINNMPLISFVPGQTVLYSHKVIYFNLENEEVESVDFATAPELRKIFETFYDLKNTSSKNEFSPEEVITKHKEKFHEQLNRHQVSSRVSMIRRTKIKPKSLLTDRFAIDFDKDKQRWIFTLC